jgi:hypothetical protein
MFKAICNYKYYLKFKHNFITLGKKVQGSLWLLELAISSFYVEKHGQISTELLKTLTMCSRLGFSQSLKT